MNEEPDLLENLKSFQFRGFVIPEYMHKGIYLYITHHIKPGDFLTAVIENNLHESMSRADGQGNLARGFESPPLRHLFNSTY